MTYATRIIRYLNACSSIPFTYSELINYRIERGQDSNLVMLLIRSQTRYPLTATRRWHHTCYGSDAFIWNVSAAIRGTQWFKWCYTSKYSSLH